MTPKAKGVTQAPFCPVCGTTYSRLEHLQRHLASHDDLCSHFCQYCGKGFKRKDVLKRHHQTCPAHPSPAGIPAKPDQKSKTNRTACDQCVRLKRACSSTQPCDTCTLRNLACTYSWLDDQGSCEKFTLARKPDAKLEGTLATTTDLLSPESKKQAGFCAQGAELIYPPSLEREKYLQTGTLDHMSFGNEFPFLRKLDVSQDGNATSPASSTHSYYHDKDPTESFEFLTRFTSNDSGMSGAFEVDSSLLAENISSPGASALNSSNMAFQYGEEPRAAIFEWQTTQARCQARQVSLESYDWEELPHMPATPESELISHSQAEPFFLLPWVEPFTLAADPLGVPQPAQSHDDDDISQSVTPGLSYSALSLKSHEIVVAIKATVVSPYSDVKLTLADWSMAKETACISFFHPDNLIRYLEYYWGLWYPNCPTIHRPSFDVARIPYQLLAPMALIGACLSPNAPDRENGRVWFDIVEEMVFSDETTFDSRTSTSNPCPPEQLESRMRSLQAAYTVCLYQNWEGQDAAKARIRRQRFGLLISTARDLMRYAKHGTLDGLQLQDFSWKTFVIREELIRTILYIFLLDTAFTIFNNLPPRMVVREMTNDLACPEPCFQAPTAEDCFDKIREWTAHPLYCKRTTLYAAIRCFGQRSIEPVTQNYLAQAGVLNLWTIVSAFHNLIFHIDPGFGSESQSVAMENAITNWRNIWRLRSVNGFKDSYRLADLEPSPPLLERKEAWKRTGFMRRAPEYWLLAQAKLERLQSTQRSLEAAETLSGRDNWLCNVPGTVLPKYDETSMEQLNEFISSFQAMRLNQEDVD